MAATASAEHHWLDCPYDAEDINFEDVDRHRQNHYYHDPHPLGCPFECRADHNHPVARGG